MGYNSTMPRGYKNTGEKLIPPNWKGKKRSQHHKEALSMARSGKLRIDMKEEKNPLWKGGISKDINKYMVNYRRIDKERKAGRKIPEQCEICGIPGADLKRGLCYDHDHKTGEFRGWLCIRCNTALGLVKDNTETLMALIEYVRKNSIKTINGLG